MEWYILAGLIGLVIAIIIIAIRLTKNKEEDIFESAGNRIKSIGACCKKLFGNKGA